MRREDYRRIGNEGDECQDLLDVMARAGFVGSPPLQMTAGSDVDYHRCG